MVTPSSGSDIRRSPSRPFAGVLSLGLAVGLGAASGPAWASTPGPTLRLEPARVASGAWMQDAPTTTESAVAAYGSPGSQWWTILVGVANDFEDATDVNVAGAWSRFLAQDIEFQAELGAWAFTDDEEFGLNGSMVFRWHFVNTGRWTVYADAGIGLLGTTDDVPADGTSFNFTPRAGVGFTRALTDDGVRLQVGLRWAHVSNARIFGDDDNPARDSAMLYAGVIFPF